MKLRYGVVNVLLCFIIFLLIFKKDQIWTPPQVTDKKEGVKKSESSTEFLRASPVPPGASFRDSLMVIAEKNIFNPDRKEFSLPAVEPAKPMSRPPIQLYGVMITNDLQTVSIANPTKPLPKGEREIKTIKIGDRVGDYRLTQILPDRITLEAPGDSYEVLLYDPKSPKKRTAVMTPSKPAEITSALPGPTPLPTPSGVAPAAIPIPSIPRPYAPSSEPKIGFTPPPSVSPAPIPDPYPLRGRRAIRPDVPPAEGRN